MIYSKLSSKPRSILQAKRPQRNTKNVLAISALLVTRQRRKYKGSSLDRPKKHSFNSFKCLCKNVLLMEQINSLSSLPIDISTSLCLIYKTSIYLKNCKNEEQSCLAISAMQYHIQEGRTRELSILKKHGFNSFACMWKKVLLMVQINSLYLANQDFNLNPLFVKFSQLAFFFILQE